MDLLELLDAPRADITNLVKAIRSGNLWSAVEPALALAMWLQGKLGKPLSPMVVGEATPLTDDDVAAKLEAVVVAQTAKQEGATVTVAGAVPAQGILVSFLLPWLLNLALRAVIGEKPKS